MPRATRHIAIFSCGLGLLAAFTPSAAARLESPSPPDWLPPTPAEGARFQLAVGEPLRIALVAAARDAEETSISIGASGMPAGATLRSTTGNPAGGVHHQRSEMRNGKWLLALVALMASGLIAAGCGDDDETTSAVETTATEATTTAEEDTTAEETTEESDDSSGSSTPDDVYNACIDVIEGTAAEDAGQTACEQARDAFEQCTQQAESAPEGDARDLAVQACQDAADQAVESLQAAG